MLSVFSFFASVLPPAFSGLLAYDPGISRITESLINTKIPIYLLIYDYTFSAVFMFLFFYSIGPRIRLQRLVPIEVASWALAVALAFFGIPKYMKPLCFESCLPGHLAFLIIPFILLPNILTIVFGFGLALEFEEGHTIIASKPDWWQ